MIKPVAREASSASAKAASAPRPRAKRGRYVSDSILARRARILEAAKAMIAESGEPGFTVRELAKRARVSVTTVYANFGDKEGVIASAMEDYFRGLTQAQAPVQATLSKILRATDGVRESVLENAGYARAYAAIFFSQSVDPRIYKVIARISFTAAGQGDWILRALRRGEGAPGVTEELVETMLINTRMSLLNDWARGATPEADITHVAKAAFLVLARGMTTGAAQAEAGAALERLEKKRPKP